MTSKHISNGFLPGASVTVRGQVIPWANSFSINLRSGPLSAVGTASDVIFHFNPRFKQGVIVRNTLTAGVWGIEELNGGILFRKGEEFKVHIQCEANCFKITVDDSHIMYYNHRRDPKIITHVEASGDVSIHQIDYKPPIVEHACGNNIMVPHRINFFIGLNNGFKLGVFGIIKKDAERFAIDLICSELNYALHFNPRFDQNTIVMNSKQNGQWGSEERVNLTLCRGQAFYVCIHYEYNGFKIFVNDIQHANFAHRMDPNKITSAYIQGGIRLVDVRH